MPSAISNLMAQALLDVRQRCHNIWQGHHPLRVGHRLWVTGCAGCVEDQPRIIFTFVPCFRVDKWFSGLFLHEILYIRYSDHLNIGSLLDNLIDLGRHGLGPKIDITSFFVEDLQLRLCGDHRRGKHQLTVTEHIFKQTIARDSEHQPLSVASLQRLRELNSEGPSVLHRRKVVMTPWTQEDVDEASELHGWLRCSIVCS